MSDLTQEEKERYLVDALLIVQAASATGPGTLNRRELQKMAKGLLSKFEGES